MVGNQCRLDAACERGKPGEVNCIRLAIGGERKRDTMKGNRMPRPDCGEPCETRGAFHKIVLRMHLEPQTVRATCQAAS